MRHTVPEVNWPRALAGMIREAEDNDTIVCRSEDQKELAERAHARMCPEKHLTFVVKPEVT